MSAGPRGGRETVGRRTPTRPFRAIAPSAWRASAPEPGTLGMGAQAIAPVDRCWTQWTGVAWRGDPGGSTPRVILRAARDRAALRGIVPLHLARDTKPRSCKRTASGGESEEAGRLITLERPASDSHPGIAGVSEIPMPGAEKRSRREGLPLDDGIVQLNSVGHPGDDGFVRLANQALCDGPTLGRSGQNAGKSRRFHARARWSSSWSEAPDRVAVFGNFASR